MYNKIFIFAKVIYFQTIALEKLMNSLKLTYVNIYQKSKFSSLYRRISESNYNL